MTYPFKLNFLPAFARNVCFCGVEGFAVPDQFSLFFSDFFEALRVLVIFAFSGIIVSDCRNMSNFFLPEIKYRLIFRRNEVVKMPDIILEGNQLPQSGVQ